MYLWGDGAVVSTCMHIGRDDLGRHVPEDTHAAERLIVGEQHAHARRLLLLESKRKPKVNQHHVLALLGHHDVACLHVAVYDAPLVQVRKHLGEGDHQHAISMQSACSQYAISSCRYASTLASCHDQRST